MTSVSLNKSKTRGENTSRNIMNNSTKLKFSSSDDEDQKPQDKQLGAKPAVVQRQVKLQTREVPQPAPAQQPTQPVKDSKTSPYVYVAIFGAAVVVGYLIYRKL